MSNLPQRRDGVRVKFKRCKCGKRTYNGTMCNACHVENGGLICQCGKQIQRGDSCCRECFAAWKPPSEYGRGKDKIDRVETTQVSIGEPRDDEMEFYHGIISAHALEGLMKWKNQQGPEL